MSKTICGANCGNFVRKCCSNTGCRCLERPFVLEAGRRHSQTTCRTGTENVSVRSPPALAHRQQPNRGYWFRERANQPISVPLLYIRHPAAAGPPVLRARCSGATSCRGRCSRSVNRCPCRSWAPCDSPFRAVTPLSIAHGSRSHFLVDSRWFRANHALDFHFLRQVTAGIPGVELSAFGSVTGIRANWFSPASSMPTKGDS